MMKYPVLALLHVFVLVGLTSCNRTDTDSGDSQITLGETRQLGDAATMLDMQQAGPAAHPGEKNPPPKSVPVPVPAK